MARILMFVFVMALSAQVAAPQGRGRGSSNRADSSSNSSAPAVSITVFTHEHHAIIREWFAQPANLRGLPPGLAKKEQLPPGLQRQLIRNGTLPPGLEKKTYPFPVALETRLPPVREGYVRVVIGGNVVVMEISTRTIVDVLSGIF